MLSLLKRLRLSDAVADSAGALARLVYAEDRTKHDFARLQSAYIELARTRRTHGDVEASANRLVTCLVHLASKGVDGKPLTKEGLAAAIGRLAAAELAVIWLPRQGGALAGMARAA